MKIGIIGAMKEELVYFRDSMKQLTQEVKGFHTFYKGMWRDQNVVISKSGVGKVNAAMTIQKMIDLYQIDKIIFTGVAGGVHPSLEIGDVVVSTSCQQHDLDASPLGFKKGTIPMYDGPSDFPADGQLIQSAFQAAQDVLKNNHAQVYKGKIVSGDQFIADEKAVKVLRADFSADCVEMEGAAVAQVAYFHGLPFVVIRSISDKANGEASENFQTFMNNASKTSSEIVERMMDT